MIKTNPKIIPFLWFDKEAEVAANFYVSTFNGNPERKTKSKIKLINHYDEAGAKASGQPEGSVMIVDFNLEDQNFTAINGGNFFKFSGAVSFLIDCKNQEEVDYFWEKLSEGGESGQCGWINRDKYGVTWQVVPTVLGKLMSDPNPIKAGKVMEAMLTMTKIDISILKKAHSGK
jgi:predicted 3-demethylubiquinone-9 3-methyltransferase (glyoxalase superfamily)